MASMKIGNFAKSKAGHDKDEIYVIMKIENEYVYLIDGKYKKLENPKKKNIKHIQIIDKLDSELQNKLDSDTKIQNEDIKRAIKCYLLSMKN